MKFVPEHFPELGDQAHYAARIANEMFKKSGCVVVSEDQLMEAAFSKGVDEFTRMFKNKENIRWIEHIWSNLNKPCEHEPITNGHVVQYICSKCGVKIKATKWEKA